MIALKKPVAAQLLVVSGSQAMKTDLLKEVADTRAESEVVDTSEAASAAVAEAHTVQEAMQDDVPAATAPDWMTRLQDSAARWLMRCLALAAGLAFWEYASAVRLNLYIRFDNVPGPLVVGKALMAHLAEGTFYLHILASLRRIAISYALASAVGITVGLLMGRSRVIRDLVSPYIELLRPIPAVAWIPLAILLLPTEESSIIFITFLGALFPIVLNAAHGVEQTPEVLVRAAQSLGASQLTIFRHVVLPGALPSIGAGLAIGMGVSWFSLLAGEIISGQYGIGYFTWNAYSIINYPDIVVGMLAIGLLGTGSTAFVRVLIRPALAWQRKAR
jgi:NitT/TauT family transport system permease protein